MHTTCVRSMECGIPSLLRKEGSLHDQAGRAHLCFLWSTYLCSLLRICTYRWKAVMPRSNRQNIAPITWPTCEVGEQYSVPSNHLRNQKPIFLLSFLPAHHPLRSFRRKGYTAAFCIAVCILCGYQHQPIHLGKRHAKAHKPSTWGQGKKIFRR